MFILDKKQHEQLTENEQTMFTANTDETQFTFTGVIPVDKTVDVEKLTKSLVAERFDHKTSKTQAATKLAELNGELTPFKEAAEIEAAKKAATAGGADPDSPTVLALKKGQEDMKKLLDDMTAKNTTLEKESSLKKIQDALRTVAKDKVVDIDDVLQYSADFAFTDDSELVNKAGVTAEAWLAETLKVKKHWIPASTPTGATGGSKTINVAVGKKRYTELMAKSTLNLQEQVEATELVEQLNKEDGN